jgi:hypothetical protein
MTRGLALFLLLSSCAPSAPPASPAAGEGVRTYTVRGEVVAPPSAEGGATQLLVRHEAIDDFVDATGKVVGMAPMVMPFQVPGQVSASGLSTGDKVEIRFTMDWKGPRLRVERIDRLPAGTVLRLGPGPRGTAAPPP